MNCVQILNQFKSDCNPIIGQIHHAWLFKKPKSVPIERAALLATWEEFINFETAARMYILGQNPNEVKAENAADIFIEGNTSFREKGKDGKQSIVITYVNLKPCKAKQLKSLDGQSMHAFFISENEYILGSGDDINFVTNEVKIFVSEPKTAEATGQGWKTEVRLELIPTTGIWNNGINPYTINGWRPSQIDGIIDVVFSNISADVATKIIVFDINAYCDNTEIVDLTTMGDFDLKIKSTGVSVNISSITYNGNTATITTSTLTAVTHTLVLKGQPTMTVKGYESHAITEFTPV